MSPQPSEQTKGARKAAYTLAAGASVAMTASDADAQIVWSTPQDIAIGQFSQQTLNLDGDIYYDLVLKNYVFGGGNYQGAYVIYGPGRTIGFQDAFAYASALSTGDLIDANTTANGFAQTSLAYGANNPNAEFNSVNGAFLGLSFPIAGELHFGWVRVTIDNAAGVFIINDWAYNITPGAGIAAGQRADFNGDGVTDIADYTVWRDSLGTTRVGDEFIPADVDLSDEVDIADYLIWAEDFGLSGVALPPGAVTNAAPEPMTLGLLAAGASGLALIRGARRRREEVVADREDAK
ncbi:MAG: PEP-CTERM sorting domain-containing protein [Planctomycetota bacterium]